MAAKDKGVPLLTAAKTLESFPEVVSSKGKVDLSPALNTLVGELSKKSGLSRKDVVEAAVVLLYSELLSRTGRENEHYKAWLRGDARHYLGGENVEE